MYLGPSFNSSISKAAGSSKDHDKVKHQRVTCRDPSKFKCACGNTYKTYKSLSTHLSGETESFACPHCSQKFKCRIGVTNHLNNHVCRKNIRNHNNDNDEMIIGNKYSSKSSPSSSSHVPSSRPPSMQSIRGSNHHNLETIIIMIIIIIVIIIITIINIITIVIIIIIMIIIIISI